MARGLRHMRPHAVQANSFDERDGHVVFFSTTLCCGRYDEDLKELQLHFVSGGVYTYFDVPMRIVRRMLTAPSAGKFFHKHIRPTFCFCKGGGE